MEEQQTENYRFHHRKVGQIEVICGPMFSGKTEELIKRLRRAQIARQKVLVFKPKVDNRYHETNVVSHSKQVIPSVAVVETRHIMDFLNRQEEAIEVIGIDEAQFFDNKLFDLVQSLANDGTRVIIAGLDQDYKSRPFGIMPNLLAVADFVTKQFAVCIQCGAPASKSQRIETPPSPKISRSGELFENKKGSLVLVGTTDHYEARCRACFIQPRH